MKKNEDKILTLPIRTNDVERHCNLLLNRVLVDCNIEVRNSKEKEMFLAEDGYRRIIALRYNKKSSVKNKDNVYTVNIVLIDSGVDSQFECYYDKKSMSIVHDAILFGMNITCNGEPIDFDYNKLSKINNKILSDLRKPLNIGMATTINKELLYNHEPLVAINCNDVNKQLELSTKQFINLHKDFFPAEFYNNKVTFVENKTDLYKFNSNNKINAFVESREFVDCILTDNEGNEEKITVPEYLIWLISPNGSSISIALQEVIEPRDNVAIYKAHTIAITRRLKDGLSEFWELGEEEEMNLLYSFSKINYKNLPKINNL